MRRLAEVLREIEQTATGDGLLQPGAAYALGALAEFAGVEPGDQAEELAVKIVEEALRP